VLVLQVEPVSAVVLLRACDFPPTVNKKYIFLFPQGYFAIVPKCLFYKVFHYRGFIEINMSTYVFKSFSSLLMFTCRSPTGAAYPAVSVKTNSLE